MYVGYQNSGAQLAKNMSVCSARSTFSSADFLSRFNGGRGCCLALRSCRVFVGHRKGHQRGQASLADELHVLCVHKPFRPMYCQCDVNSGIAHIISRQRKLKSISVVHTHRERERGSERARGRLTGEVVLHPTSIHGQWRTTLPPYQCSRYHNSMSHPYQYESSILGKVSRLVVVWVI